MARNSTERLVAVWSRENPLFAVNRQYGQNINSTSIYNNVILYCSHEVLFLACCSCRTHLTVVSLANIAFVHTDSICVS